MYRKCYLITYCDCLKTVGLNLSWKPNSQSLSYLKCSLITSFLLISVHTTLIWQTWLVSWMIEVVFKVVSLPYVSCSSFTRMLFVKLKLYSLENPSFAVQWKKIILRHTHPELKFHSLLIFVLWRLLLKMIWNDSSNKVHKKKFKPKAKTHKLRLL
jgi:hypothetical protein